MFLLFANAAIASPAGKNTLAGSPSIAQDQAQYVAEHSAKPINDPSVWVTLNDYPTDTYDEGTTHFRLTIGPSGRAIKCQITVSSGSERLDEATCRNLIRRARFSPATNSKGEVIVGSHIGTMRWYIPD
jgi:protein TonB